MGASQSQLESQRERQPQPQPQQHPHEYQHQHQQPQPQPQPQHHPHEYQHQQQPRPHQQSQPQPQPQPQPQQHPHEYQHQQQPRPHQQSQPQQHPHEYQHQQPQPHQPSQPQPHVPANKEARLTPRRETWLLSPQGDAKSSTNSSTKEAQNATVNVKARETQSMSTPLRSPLMNKELKFPHNYEHILKDADSPVDKSSREKLCDQLYAGVFLNHKTKKYWVEKKSNSNCFMLYARALKITWAEDQNYWKWVPQKDASGTMIEVAELKKVCWLEVHGHLDTRTLSPGVLYEVSFVIMLKDPAPGWEHPVNVRLVLPVAGGKKQQLLHKENFIEKSRACWIEIPVGEFVASDKDAGEMEISMYEYEGGMWKQGLVIKGVAIKPKD